MQLIIHPHAMDDLLDAARYYDRQVPGLGNRFSEVVETGTRRIFESPDRWRQLNSGVRQYLVKRFPYQIIYRRIDGNLQILAVAHHKQEPEFWR